nr:hypothetical protein [Nannocystis pusilla]
MQQVVLEDDLLGGLTGDRAGEHRLAAGRAHGDQVVVEAGDDVALADQALEGVGVFLDGEDLGARAGEHDLDRVTHAGAAEVVLGEPHDLLRGAAALHRGVRHGEDRPALAQPADEVPGAIDELEAVVAAHAVAAERGGQPVDLVPVELDPGRHHQPVVADAAAVAGDEAPLLRLKLDDGVADPRGPARDEAGLGPHGGLPGRSSAADEGPQRLVVVPIRGLDDGDVGLGERASQARRDGDAAGAAADDDDLVVVRHDAGRGCRSRTRPRLGPEAKTRGRREKGLREGAAFARVRL